MTQIKAYGATAADSPITQLDIPRRDVLPTDVKIDILFCGICHSDLHYARNEWSDVMPTIYPCVPGHEIIGKVSEVGNDVTKFKVGDTVGVGCLVELSFALFVYQSASIVIYSIPVRTVWTFFTSPVITWPANILPIVESSQPGTTIGRFFSIAAYIHESFRSIW